MQQHENQERDDDAQHAEGRHDGGFPDAGGFVPASVVSVVSSGTSSTVSRGMTTAPCDPRVAESMASVPERRPESAPAHTACTPATTRLGSRMRTEVTSNGCTAGWTRYVRAQPSVVLSSPITVPIGIPRGYTPPTPELTIGVPVGRAALSWTPFSSRRYRSGLELICARTIPNALPSAAIALTRKSGCAQMIARLIVGSTVSTIPTSPSGATTGLNGR